MSGSEEKIYRYEDGPVPDNALRGDPALVAAIDAHIAERYGPASTVWRHPISESEGSPIHVRIVQPTPERPAITAITVGMIAHFPHDYSAFLGPGNTIQNPYPWSPNGFTGALIADQVLTPSESAELMTHDGREIHFLGVWFLYQDEMQLKLDEGVDRLWDLCVDAGISETVDAERPSAAPHRKRRGLFRRGYRPNQNVSVAV